ncbi:hypothetical protein ACLB2K_050106 [Fragaria x ananassa]
MHVCFNKVICDYALEWKKGQNSANADIMYSYSASMLSCEMSPLNFFKLNIDGTRATASEKIGTGRVIRNHAGAWIIGFINLGVGEILAAEAWGILHGLRLVANLHISKLEIETDSVILLNLMHS